MKTLGVYIHVPFCVQKCAYCDFLSSPATRQAQIEYLRALKREIESESVKYKEFEVDTVFFGGGTPSILESNDIIEVMQVLRKFYNISENAEVSMEVNPATANLEKMIGLRNAGVNRLSIGLQSTNDEELKLLGRVHSYEDFLETYSLARAVGFDNINIDLMSALPGQTIETWLGTLNRVLDLRPQHISAYSLIIEEGTRLYDELDKFPPIPDEDEDRKMYQETKRILAQKGYERYEISNYAQKGYESRHNIRYWKRDNYVGFGLGSASMVENVRWNNTSDMEVYLKELLEKTGSVKDDIQKLTENECMEEFMFLGLRMIKGVSKTDFYKAFGKSIGEVYGSVILKWKKENILTENDDYIALSDKGIDISNVVLSEFLL